MFLFINDSRLLKKSAAASMLGAWGSPKFFDMGGARLLMLEDGFTIFSEHEGVWEVGHHRPGIDSQPICGFRWRAASYSGEMYRRWSGEFALYYNFDGFLCVASHLKLIKLLDHRFRKKEKLLEAGCEVNVKRNVTGWSESGRNVSKFFTKFQYDFDTTVRKVRTLVHDSVDALPDNSALLLSGGIDSSAMAAAAINVGKKFQAFTFSTSYENEPKNTLENDRLCAIKVAQHLGIPLQKISIEPKHLIRNLPLAVFLSETPRGTIIDESTALIELARHIRNAGYRHVWIGEAADDLFGGFKFTLRYYQGQQLRKYYRQQLKRDLPNELAMVQNNFSPWGISVVDPFWTPELMSIGYNLPLRYRIDPRRLMKLVLREAFSGDLPEQIVTRPKCVTRDATGVRVILEDDFGTSRDRYRSIFNELFKGENKWNKKLIRTLSRYQRRQMPRGS